MSMRVTNSMQLLQSEWNIQSSKASLATLDNEASSGVKLNLPSDDPTGTANLLGIKQQQAQNTQYQRNAADGSGWLRTLDTTLTSVETDVQKLRNLTVEAANGTNSTSSDTALSDQMQAVKSDLLSLANTQYQGRTVFAGTSDAGVAFNSSDYSFTGSNTGTVERRINATTTVQVDANRSQIFGSGSNSLFSLIDQISTATATGGDVSSYLSSIDTYEKNVLGAHSTVGANQNRLNAATASISTNQTALTSARSSIENVDTAQVIVQLENQQNTYQMALQVTAQSSQKTLMDYLS
ncbi:flagellar hook-associated protein FlgL [Curtobacterium sp. MCBD17_040]|uniref:flagellar hook-associated protein FlgL n=1 Tax=Curtobacterium sp. MCBD17_040 TaxID=2175674 RepID=UPI000DA9FAAE|nr:flagellar hook-associated protein FlgL [Curtobacterium sp. MCBD17_040]WIB65563.1 flagellar hook-associated protein FlgL [Curtobacterium sp. MCBD17_040]